MSDQKGKGYSSRYRGIALSAFLKTRTLSGVRRELKRQGYKNVPCWKTLEKWRDAENWEDRLRDADRLDAGNVDPEAPPLKKLYNEVSLMRELARKKVFDEKTGTLRADSNSQDFYAYRGMAETEARILSEIAKAEKTQAQETPVPVIFNALKKHKRIGKLLEDPKVLSELEDLIVEEQMQFLRKSVGLS